MAEGNWGVEESETSHPRRAGPREQHRLHLALGWMLATSRIPFPMSTDICISYFKFLGTIVDYLLFKTSWGGVGDAAIITSGLQHFPFCLQSSHILCASVLAEAHGCSPLLRQVLDLDDNS